MNSATRPLDVLATTVFYPDAYVEGAAAISEEDATVALREAADEQIRRYFGRRKVEVLDDLTVEPNVTDAEGGVVQWVAYTEVRGRRPASYPGPDDLVAYPIEEEPEPDPEERQE